MLVRRALGLLAIAACGRGGFDDYEPGFGDVDGLMVSDPGSLVIEDGHYDVAPRADGDGYALAWAEFPRGEATPRIMFAIVDEAARRIVGPATVEILPDGSGGVRLFAGTDGYLVAFRDPYDLVFVALDTGGNIRARRVPGSYGYSELELAATASGFAGAFTAAVGVDPDRYNQVFTFAIGPDGDELVAPVQLESATATQVDPAVAWSGDDLAVAWTDFRSGGARIRFARTLPGASATSAPVYDVGEDQGLAYLVPDGATGFLIAFDGYDTFPQHVIRTGPDGVPMWPAPSVIYDEPRYHDTLDVAGSPGGRAGFAWITEAHTLLTNVEFVTVDGNVGSAPQVQPPRLLTDPLYSFCYPEIARGRSGFGVGFAGEVAGSLGLFLAIVPD